LRFIIYVFKPSRFSAFILRYSALFIYIASCVIIQYSNGQPIFLLNLQSVK